MVTATLRTVGGSVMVALPKSMLEDLGLQSNQQVDISLAEGKMIVAARKRPKYTLAELLADCDPSVPRSEEEELWLSSGPVGREEI